MKDQIKIQVSDDGLFGREVNPHDKYIDGGYINEDWIQFSDTHPQLPLTTPQIPKSVVMGEVVWQTKHYSGDTWYESPNMVFVNDDNEIVSASVKDTRQAYKIITPVPNSEPKETVEQASYKYYRSTDHLAYDETPTVQQCFIAGANWQAQQQPVSKSEEKLKQIENIVKDENRNAGLRRRIIDLLNSQPPVK